MVVSPNEVGQNFRMSLGLMKPRPSFFSLPSKLTSRQPPGSKVKPVRLVETFTSSPSKNFDHVPVSRSRAITSTSVKGMPATWPWLLVPTKMSLTLPHRLPARSLLASQGAKSTWLLTASPAPGPTPLGPVADPHQLQIAAAALAGPERTPKALLPAMLLRTRARPLAAGSPPNTPPTSS